jgi:hypothetical protein
MLTRVHREVLNDISTEGHPAKTYTYSLGTFTITNTMFDNIKLT